MEDILIQRFIENCRSISRMQDDEYGDKNKVKSRNKLFRENRNIAMDIDKHTEGKSAFFSALVNEQDDTIKLMISHHMLEVMSYEKQIREEALEVIKNCSQNSTDNLQRLGEQMWLEQWYKMHPEDM